MCPAPKVSLRVQCLLDQLLSSLDEQGRGMHRTALRDELMTLLVAGQETSAILLGWACAFLADHPDVQQRAAEEVQQVCFRLQSPILACTHLAKICCVTFALVFSSNVGPCVSCQACAPVEQDAHPPADVISMHCSMLDS